MTTELSPTMTPEQFFEFALRDVLGDAGSSVEFYTSGEATKADFDNIFQKLLEQSEPGSEERKTVIEYLADTGAIAVDGQAGIDYFVNTPIESLGEDVQNFVNASTTFFLTDPDTGAVPGGATGVMPGGTLTKITRSGQPDLWAMTYVYAGVQQVYTFDSFEQMESILGAGAVSSGNFGLLTLPESTLNDGDTWIIGEAASLAGQQGNYQAWFDDLLQEAALEAGVRDPGAVGDFLSNPEVQRIMAEGSEADWSDARIQAEVRNTDYYLNTLYPGIANILNAGLPNPEASYSRYINDVSSSLEMLGYALDADGTYKSIVGTMLDGGITAAEFSAFAPTFVRAEQSQEFASVLDKWTQADLGIALDFDNWFDVLAGSSTPEMANIVEKATIQFQAEQTGTTLDAATITRLADMTQLTEVQVGAAFNAAEESLLSIGAQELDRFGLTEGDLIASAFSIRATSGLSSVEVQRRAKKAATELGLADDPKAQFFLGFDQGGRPVRSGLAASSVELG